MQLWLSKKPLAYARKLLLYRHSESDIFGGVHTDPEYLVFFQVTFNNKVSGLPINKLIQKMKAFGSSKTSDSHIADCTVS
jgi:hypothetical protein